MDLSVGVYGADLCQGTSLLVPQWPLKKRRSSLPAEKLAEPVGRGFNPDINAAKSKGAFRP